MDLNRAIIEIDGAGEHVSCRIERRDDLVFRPNVTQIRESKTELIADILSAEARTLMKMSEDELRHKRAGLLPWKS